jgi:ribose 1,5-bisphosphokinase
MGPSGAGKDSVLRYARERLAGSGVLFAHRYITRRPVAGDENFVSLDPAEFAARRARGLFAFDWEAHGCAYGIGLEIEAWLDRGATVVVSGSRAHFSGRPIAGAVAVLVTARPDILAERLAGRRREDESAIRVRLDRAALPCDAGFTIDNSGPLAEAGEAVVALLSGVGRGGIAA